MRSCVVNKLISVNNFVQYALDYQITYLSFITRENILKNLGGNVEKCQYCT